MMIVSVEYEAVERAALIALGKCEQACSGRLGINIECSVVGVELLSDEHADTDDVYILGCICISGGVTSCETSEAVCLNVEDSVRSIYASLIPAVIRSVDSRTVAHEEHDVGSTWLECARDLLVRGVEYEAGVCYCCRVGYCRA